VCYILRIFTRIFARIFARIFQPIIGRKNKNIQLESEKQYSYIKINYFKFKNGDHISRVFSSSSFS